MEALKLLYTIIKSNLGKVAIVFVLSGVIGVLGLVPGTENLSNAVGSQITNIKTTLGTAASPTIVQ
ncbi:hypothetical protein ABIB06_006535 [Bradyrhizobium sp. LB8.2]|uniref:hypothetical protein n=1 Tax=unclassified Bradyrhizobium TaxID=2631580 RepID=UPI0033995285